jgi:hypothetical protein
MHLSYIVALVFAAGVIARPGGGIGRLGEKRSLGSAVDSAVGAIESGAANAVGSVEAHAKDVLAKLQANGCNGLSMLRIQLILLFL